MAAPSKTVCLRAFNEDLDGANPWESKSAAPPPVPKRIAWPGGKIVSNKDEALASFLRRKLDQGQTLTPEQMAMLEKMVVGPNSADSAPTAAAPRATGAGSKRKNRRGGGGRGGGRKDSGGVTVTTAAAVTDARVLLHKLEHKVATASFPEDFSGGEVGNFHDFRPTSRRGRRKVDLSSLKRSQVGRGALFLSGKFSKNSTARARARARLEDLMSGGLAASRR